jgi:tetratricopeptide (TPR) repeat protein
VQGVIEGTWLQLTTSSAISRHIYPVVRRRLTRDLIYTLHPPGFYRANDIRPLVHAHICLGQLHRKRSHEHGLLFVQGLACQPIHGIFDEYLEYASALRRLRRLCRFGLRQAKRLELVDHWLRSRGLCFRRAHWTEYGSEWLVEDRGTFALDIFESEIEIADTTTATSQLALTSPPHHRTSRTRKPMLEDNDPRLRRIQALQRSYRALQSDLPDLDERIRLLRVLVAEACTDHTRLPAHRYDLATALYSRFMHTREFSDLDEAEPCVRLALSSPMLGTQPEFPGPSSLLGSILRERAYETKAVEASEEAVSLHRLPFQGEHRMATSEEAYHSRELGQTLRVHSTVTAVDETLVLESIERLKDAQRLFALQEVVDHDTALGLGGALQALYDLKMNRPHLEEANSYGMVALTACGKSHRDFYRVVTTSAHLQYLFAWYYNQLDLLDGAIGLLRAALLDVPAGWAGIMTIYLAGALQLRFTKQTREDDLSEAITRVSTMLLSLTPDHTSWDKLQQVLGMTLFTRFQLTGASEDIEGATRAAGLALSRSNAGSVAYLRRLNIFATCRAEQYKAYGNVGYLSECIGLFEQIKQLADSKSMMWRLATENLLEAFQDRFRHTGNKEDLNRAIDLVPILVAHLNKERADAPLVLLSAGNAFLMRFEADGSAEDLDQATAFHKENADGHAASQPAHLASFEILYLYAKTLRIRYEALDEEESASKALELFNQLYAAVPDAHPERARLLCGLARLRLCASPEEEVEKALDYLLDSLNNNYCLAYKRLGEVSSVLTYLASRAVSHTMILRNASKLTAVYATAIALLPEAASFGLEASTRVAVVASAGQLTNQGALYAIISGQPQVGLQLLEAGRNIFWTQCLHLRTSFADLPEAMGDNLTKIARALERPFPDALEGAEKDDELTRRRQLGDDFRAGIAEARLLPGFEDLLQNTPFASLARAAQHRPIVVLVAGENSSHAIIIFEDPRCQLVTLARATAKILQALSRGIETYNHSVRSTRGMRKVNPVQVRSVDAYHELWCLVMLPIVEALGWPVSTAVVCIDMLTDVRQRRQRDETAAG